MKKFTFVFYEYDSQASQCSKYYFVKVLGRDWSHAYKKAKIHVNKRNEQNPDYNSKLLTLNQFNEVKRRGKDEKYR